ncbi:putative C6 finger domain protein [Taphrina deformans PYCC 5710]|uniref:C6 finger domain protein n=1 Tax=Taphrina deformans (strain PYCC 5710 / ATCC 11124 / CBS 356.35 / IMI 108563 / JCM 9778 / NBRC 8474) TaxID=1097556 RepID=R4XDP7_TAPDE|nr:putative C6 finger domain protein [Taphrina deformans PYCC 5710]|eukprot:CCG81464.1 putative C6 finger domain protein [Taphrina deformans PYCC 5710]
MRQSTVVQQPHLRHTTLDLDLNTLLAANDVLSRRTPSKPMLAPSLLASAEYYCTPDSEKGVSPKKRFGSPHKSPEADLQEPGMSKHPGLQRRISDITSDISLDNLLEGSRRKRNKFSSDLPLLPLPTPTSASRQNGHARTQSGARDRAYSGSTTGTIMQTPGRVSIPTPAPTTISDEDVALQLIRLGDPSLSPCKAPSDESSSPIPNLTTAMHLKAFHDGLDYQSASASEKQEVNYPSSPPASVSDEQEPPVKRAFARQADQAEAEVDFKRETSRASLTSTAGELEPHLKDDTDVEEEIDIPRPQNLPHFHDSMQCKSLETEPQGEEDERAKKNGPSVGVRCTRCKKSKKGCDRQRPCGRCADANEDCVTEDESSGRRGRNNRGGRRKR